MGQREGELRPTFYRRYGKRGLDILLAGLALVILFFPLLALIALAVKVDSAGAILYVQQRAGRFGKPFPFLKFRSMVMGAEHMGTRMRVEKDDPRITRVGRWLRRFSLDEIPQLLNVLAGHMSLVGPRPVPLYQVAQYDETQRRRLLLRPGLTGWAQIHGRNVIDWGRRIELDLEYLERHSLGMDLRILFRTIPRILAGSGLLAEREYWRPDTRDPGGGPPPQD